MANMLDYLNWRGDIPITVDGINDIDRMILAQLSYFDLKSYSSVLKEGFDKRTTLAELCEWISDPQHGVRYHVSTDQKLAELLMKSKRFGEIELTGYEEKFNIEKEEQFAAITALLPDNTAACIFRGTDWSLVGWKEDLNMALSDQLPAQLDAVDYMKRLAQHYHGTIRVIGHSKGGNLAVYASAFANSEITLRVIETINLDGPGFSKAVIESPQYSILESRIRTIIPQSSLVGVIFAHTGKFTIVSSNAPKLMQHDLYSWQVLGPAPVTLTERDSSSQFVESALNDWIDSLPREQRERFISGIWSLLDGIGVTEISDILRGKNTLVLLSALSRLDDETRSVITDTLARLRKSVKGSLLTVMGKNSPQDNNAVTEIKK